MDMSKTESWDDLLAQKRARLARPPRKQGWRFVQSWGGALAYRAAFRDLETFCAFIGYPRSGHTLIGSLLDAHPQAVIADELDALRFLQAGFDRRQVFYLMLRNSRNFAADGRERTGYPYRVPGQWQGRFEKLRVIGDKFGGVTETRLKFHPTLLDSLPWRLELKTRYIHVLRNPYDIIATLHLRQRHTLTGAVQRFFLLCDAVGHIKSRLPRDVFEMRHEEFLDDAKAMLRGLCGFLGLAATDDYLDACAAIVHRSPHKSRHDVAWPGELLEEIAGRMEQFEFLKGYSFES